jgi:hypothetical protein
MLADADVVADAQLARKRGNHPIDHIGNIILGQNGQTGKNDGQRGKYFPDIDLKKRQYTGNQPNNHQQGVDMPHANDQIIISPDFMPPPVPPRGKELYKIQEHEKYSHTGNRIHIIGNRSAVFPLRIYPGNIPLAKPDQKQHDENAEFK